MDGHAHFHARLGHRAFLEAAVANLRRGAAEAGLAAPGPGVLLLVEPPGRDDFSSFRRPGRHGAGSWRARETAEDVSVLLRREGEGGEAFVRPDRDELVLVAGRQLPTREGIEVLAVGSRRPLPAGLSLEETLEAVRRAGALPILPWGLGKWWSGRGGLVRHAIHDAPRPFFLGDTPHRPRRAPELRMFAAARRAGVPVLPGSDSLAFGRAGGGVGSYGFITGVRLDPERPAVALRRWLLGGPAQPVTFGRPGGWAAFLRTQLALNLGKRMRRGG